MNIADELKKIAGTGSVTLDVKMDVTGGYVATITRWATRDRWVGMSAFFEESIREAIAARTKRNAEGEVSRRPGKKVEPTPLDYLERQIVTPNDARIWLEGLAYFFRNSCDDCEGFAQGVERCSDMIAGLEYHVESFKPKKDKP